MARIRLCTILLVLLIGPVLIFAGAQDEVAAATQAWAEAINRHDVDRLLALYAPEAVVWGTMASTLLDTPEAIRDYFRGIADQPHGRVTLGEQRIRVYGALAINTGSYTFSNVRDGQPITSPARFSFVYHQRDGSWLIVDHHSSFALPPRP
jgi:uncharacterized protein (TIGR02246 family)